GAVSGVSRARRALSALSAVLALLALVALSTSARADDVLVLKDGRRIAVRRLARRDGQVLFETTRGERFSVAEDLVVSPPLDSIPSLDAATPMPMPEAMPSPAPTVEASPVPVPSPGAPPVPAVTAAEPDFVPVRSRWDLPFPNDPRWPRGRL